MPAGRQVLVHGPAVGDETQAQLKVSSQATVRGQGQDQQRGDQEEAHDQQSHAAPVTEQIRAVGGRSVRPDLGRARAFGKVVWFSTVAVNFRIQKYTAPMLPRP